MEDDRVAILENQLAQAKLIAEEADKKYEEVQPPLFILTRHYHYMNVGEKAQAWGKVLSSRCACGIVANHKENNVGGPLVFISISSSFFQNFEWRIFFWKF